MSTKGIVQLAQDLGKFVGAIRDKRHINKVGHIVLDAAISNCTGFKVTSGELRGSIGLTVTDGEEGPVAHIGTQKEYAMYVELGTGPKGQADHAGISPDVQPAYRASHWWIHESMVDEDAAEVYGWQSINTKQGRFYRVSGQPAHPYLYPALKDHTEDISRVFKDGWTGVLRTK